MTDREKLIELLDDVTHVYHFDAWENTDKIADHLLANGVTVQPWISVEDRLPKDDVQVLACTKHGKAFSAHCENGRWRVSGSVKITHWMPLPEPPREVSHG